MAGKVKIELVGWGAGKVNTELMGCEAGGTVGAVIEAGGTIGAGCEAGGTIGDGCEAGETIGAGCEWLSIRGNALGSCLKSSILVGPGLLQTSV